MGDVLTFPPRLKPSAPEALEPLSRPELRASLEEAAQTALDAADRIIAVLDRMDGDADHEDSGDAAPSLAAPENVTGSQVVYMRSGDRDCEEAADEPVLPEMAVELSAPSTEATVIPVSTLRWSGRGNVIAAAGTALINLLERA